MKRTFSGILVLVMAMMLAACGGQPAAPAANDNGSNTTASNNNTASGSEPAGLEFLKYDVKITGAATTQVAGTLQVMDFEENERMISFAGPSMTTQVILQIPAGVQPGQYALARTGDYRGQISTSFKEDDIFTSDVSGTLNITSGSPLAGTLEFSAKNDAGETVTAAGSFEEIIYSFDAHVSGAVELTLPPGQATILTLMDQSILTIENMATDETTFSISFYLPQDVVAGEYGLSTTYPEPAEGQLGMIMTANGSVSASYDQAINGTLTLTEVGETLTGTFKVTAADADGNSITAEGTFKTLPVQRSTQS